MVELLLEIDEQWKIEGVGFQMNPYDACMANKMINSKQFTVVWHVDDLKASHVSLDVLKEFGNELNKEFGNETPITESYEKK